MRWIAIVGTLTLVAALLPTALAGKSSAPAEAGQACSVGKKKCRTGLMCTDGNVCVVPAGLGQACIANSCESGLGCTNGVCSPLGKLGEACTVNSCEPPYTCTNGICDLSVPPP